MSVTPGEAQANEKRKPGRPRKRTPAEAERSNVQIKDAVHQQLLTHAKESQETVAQYVENALLAAFRAQKDPNRKTNPCDFCGLRSPEPRKRHIRHAPSCKLYDANLTAN